LIFAFLLISGKCLDPSGVGYFVTTVNVRSGPSISSEAVAQYSAGETVQYDKVVTSEGRTWISYIAGSGKRRYCCAIDTDGSQYIVNKSPTPPGPDPGKYQKYDLSDTQVIKIARLCNQEQGSVNGAKAEASLMANQLETSDYRRNKYGTGGDGLYNWVRNGGWFSRAAYWMDNGSASQAIIDGVRDVLVNGQRTLPQYVDEHDCISDISSISTGDKNDHDDYISGETIVKNCYGSTWTFYSFPAAGSDPFGYTAEAYDWWVHHH